MTKRNQRLFRFIAYLTCHYTEYTRQFRIRYVIERDSDCPVVTDCP